MSTLLAVNLDSVTLDNLRDGLDSAPLYQRFGDAVKHVIRSIHAIPTLFKGATLGHIEVYLGRAGGTAEHIAKRFRSHRAKKDHEHGAIIMEGATKDIISWEGTANRIILRLMDRGVLCVANMQAGENGPTPSTPTSVVYMTWREVRRVAVNKPDSDDVDEIAEEVAASKLEARDAKQLATALKPITRPQTEIADIEWHDDHEE